MRNTTRIAATLAAALIAAVAHARDFTSRSSQSLRMYGTDSFAACRSIAWSAGGSVSQTFFENTSTSGASECSERL